MICWWYSKIFENMDRVLAVEIELFSFETFFQLWLNLCQGCMKEHWSMIVYSDISKSRCYNLENNVQNSKKRSIKNVECKGWKFGDLVHRQFKGAPREETHSFGFLVHRYPFYSHSSADISVACWTYRTEMLGCMDVRCRRRQGSNWTRMAEGLSNG